MGKSSKSQKSSQSKKQDSLAFKAQSPLAARKTLAAKNAAKNSTGALGMLKQILDMQRELQKKIDDLYENGRAHKIDVDAFFRQSTAISKEDIEKYKACEKALLEELKLISSPTPIKSSKTADKLTQERKGKTRGARNKWIPMM